LRDDREQLEARLAAQKAQLRDLATMGAVITSIREIDAVLSVVMDMAIELVKGEVGMILSAEEDDRLHSRICWGVTDEFIRSLDYRDDMNPADYCYKHRETIILEDMDAVSREGISVKTAIAVPIKKSDRCFGVMIVFNKIIGGNFTAEDQEALEMLLNFVAVAVDNARLAKEELTRQKMQQEMAIARQVQETLLPLGLEQIPGVEIGAEYVPAREVGGDFYDVIKVDQRNLLVILGDVSNKGVPAALVMSALSGILKSAVKANPLIGVADLAGHLNDALVQDIIRDRDMFVTMFFCRFDLATSALTWCNAGHIPGLFWDAAEGQVVELKEGGPIVGQFADIPYQQRERRLSPGDRLFLFTDGLTEAEDASGELFGRTRALDVFASQVEKTSEEFCRLVRTEVDRFAAGAAEDAQDDFTVLQIKVVP